MAAWQMLKHKQWRTVGVALIFNDFNSPKKYLWIDILSQSWTNPMHLLWAYGLRPSLKVVCPWYVSGSKFVTAPKFMNGCFFRLVLVMSIHNLDQYLIQNYLFRIWSMRVFIQYQDLCQMIVLDQALNRHRNSLWRLLLAIWYHI